MYKRCALTLVAALACFRLSEAQPTRRYDDSGAPPFKVLREGENPPLDSYGNFVIGPKYVTAPERKVVEGVPRGKVRQFVIDSNWSFANLVFHGVLTVSCYATAHQALIN